MTGESDLRKLLATLSPSLQPDEYVFCHFQDGRYGDNAELEPIAAFQESEGLTLVIPRSRADEHDISYSSVFRAISLGVHSSLEAVGLTAAFATQLAEQGISANVFAGYFHDHIFVESRDAEGAMAALNTLAVSAAGR